MIVFKENNKHYSLWSPFFHGPKNKRTELLPLVSTPLAIIHSINVHPNSAVYPEIE